MFELFRDAHAFNQDLSTWDTSNVRNMSKMFDRARNFNNGEILPCSQMLVVLQQCLQCFGMQEFQ